MPVYKVDNNIYDIPEDKIVEFLAKYPNASIVKEEEKEEEEELKPKAVVGNEIAPAVAQNVNTELQSAPGSLESQKPTTNAFGVPLEKFKVNNDEFKDVIESFKVYDR